MKKIIAALAAAAITLTGCETSPDNSADTGGGRGSDVHPLGQPLPVGRGVEVTITPGKTVKLPKNCSIADYCGKTFRELSVKVSNKGESDFNTADMQINDITTDNQSVPTALIDHHMPKQRVLHAGKSDSWKEAFEETKLKKVQVALNVNGDEHIFEGDIT